MAVVLGAVSKSDLILGLALKAHQNSIIFRREYPQLKGLIKRSKQIVNGNGRYNGTDKVWSDLPEGRSLEFGSCQYEDDKEKYQGRDHSLKAFDEITSFTRSQFEYIIGWNRSAIPGERCRVVATGNPPMDPKGLWVIQYWGPWLNPDDPLYGKVKDGDLVWYVVDDEEDIVVGVGNEKPDNYVLEDGTELEPHSRSFISASMADNPYLAKTNYKSVLQGLPKELREALLEGKFTLSFEDDPWQVVPSEWVESAFKRYEALAQKPDIMTSLGVDVARGGRDSTVLCPKFGNVFGEILEFPGSTTPDGQAVAALVVQNARPGAQINIDVIGVGASAYDILKLNNDVFPVSASTKSVATDSSGKMAFKNLRSEMIWKVREALDPETGKNWAIPRDTNLKAELCAARYGLSAPTERQQMMGALYQIVVASKDNIKDEIGRSPDRADALSYAAYEDTRTPITVRHGGIRRG